MRLRDITSKALTIRVVQAFEKITDLRLVIVLYVTSMATVLFFPKLHWHIKSFNQILGNAAINDYDVGKLVANFYLYFIVIAGVFVLSMVLVQRIEERISLEDKNKKEQLKTLFVLGIVLNFTQFIGIGSGRLPLGTGLFLIAILAYAFVTFRRWKTENITWLIIVGISLCLPLGLVLSRVIHKATVIYPVALVLAFFLCGILTRFSKSRLRSNFSVLFVCLPLFTFGFIEFIHIAAQRGLVIGSPFRNYLVIVGVAIGLIYFGSRKIRFSFSQDRAAVICLLGLSLLMAQSGYYLYGNADLFESANSSVLISDFFNYGRLPIVSHFGGHMLAGAIEGILYGIVSGDHFGAIFAGAYGGYLIHPCLSLLLYGLFRHVFDDSLTAFLIVLFFPFDWTINSYGLGLVVALATAHFAMDNSWKSTLWLMLAMIATCLYRLDLGYSFALAAVLVSAWLILIRKKSVDCHAVWFPVAGIVFAMLTLWVLLCWQQGSNPILRLREFLTICASNPNWAYSTLGNKNLFAFGWSYLLMPFACVIALVWLLVKQENYKKSTLYVTVMVAVLGFAYFTNFTRGLVRHSVAEMALHFSVWCGYLFLACFAGLVLKKKWLMLPVFLALCMTNGLLKSNESYGSGLRIQYAAMNNFYITRGWINKEGNGRTFTKNLQSGVHSTERLQLNETLASEIDDWKQLFDTVLTPDETYLDFTNHSFMYSATRRLDPVYAAQSPGHLSGVFSQEMFVRDARANREKIPLALMPGEDKTLSASLDGVSNVIRYYKVAEYIYQNYRPLVAFNIYRVWVLKERYEEFASKLFGEAGGRIPEKEVLTNFLANRPECINCNMSEKDGRIVVDGMTSDPIVGNVQKQLDLGKFIGRRTTIRIRYRSSKVGFVQLFYATTLGEGYTEAKSLRCNSGYEGEVTFTLPFNVTEFTRLRLDTPAYSVFEIESVKIEEQQSRAPIDYGYDQAHPSFHRYYLNQLPRIWGDYGCPQTESADLKVVRQPTEYSLAPDAVPDKQNGNYLVLAIDSEGDSGGNGMTLVARGRDGTERYKFTFTLAKGSHQYVFRVSSDYWWYADDIRFELKGGVPYRLKRARLMKGD